jgi:hypothetical protein
LKNIDNLQIRHTDKANTPSVAKNMRQFRGRIAAKMLQTCGKDAAKSRQTCGKVVVLCRMAPDLCVSWVMTIGSLMRRGRD